MGLLDWVLRPFRGRSPEPEPEPWSADVAPTPPPVRAREDAPTKARKEKAPKPPRPERPKGSKKARKAAASAAKAEPPRAEVMSVEEAERRYGALVREARLPSPAEAPREDEAPAERGGPARAGRAHPAERSVPLDPAAEARRAEARENRARARVPQFQALLSHADALLAVADAEARHLKAARDELVRGWKALGPPPADQAEALNAARDACVAALEARAEAGFAARDEERRQNMVAKMAVIEEARALAEREDLKGAGPEMGGLRTKLRAIGPVSPEDHEVVVAAFAAAEARLKERQEQVREDRDIARREALERLTRLATQAESLATFPDAEQAAERVKGLQAQWKAVKVPGPRGGTDELWTRFRAACDAVFARRAEARVEGARVTLERMEAVVQRAEALAESLEGDPEDAIHKLMNDWKRAGRAPRDAQNALWERLQRAFDRIRNPPVDWRVEEDPGLQFRPFERLTRDDE